MRFYFPLFLVFVASVGAPLRAQENNTNAMLSLFSSAQSSIDPVKSASNKVKLSGRQALLSQQIANSLCFVFLGIDQDENLLKAAQASALYSESLDALRSGSVQKEIRKEDNQEILDALRALSESWRPLKNIVNSVLTTREPKDSDLEAIEALNLSVLEDSVRLARLIEGHYGQNELGAEIASTISFAGNQRTLGEKATKEFCLVMANINRTENQAGLMETRLEFFESMFNLFLGNPELGIIAPTNYELDIHYQELFSAWFLLEEIFDQWAPGRPLGEADVQLAQRVTDFLTTRSEQALGMY